MSSGPAALAWSEAIGVVSVAMAEEADPFLALGHEVDAVDIGGTTIRTVEHEGLRFVLLRSGIGLINAANALSTALMATGLADPLVISAGSAGGLVPATLHRLVVGTEFINIDADLTAFGYPRGQVPEMPLRYTADPRVERLLADQHPFTGPIGSTYSFVTSAKASEILDEWPEMVAVDMESVALAQVAQRHQFPFAFVRGVSDLTLETDNQETFDDHVVDAGQVSARAALTLLHRWAEQPGSLR